MPEFDIQDPRTGRQLTIEGDSEPTESELEQLFAATEPIPTVQPFYAGESTIAGAPGRNPLVGTPQVWENLGGPRVNPTLAITEALLGPHEIRPEESVVGLSPERVPTGAEMTKSTGIPKFATIPLSGTAKALAGLGQFITSPQGGVEMGVAAIPGIGLVQRAKFIHDMAKGTGESVGNLAAEIENARANPQQVDSDTFQRMAEETANTALQLYGAGKLTSHEFSRITGVRAPLGRFLESEKTRISKDVAEQLLKTVRDEQLPLAEDMLPVPGLIPPNAPRELGLPPVTTEPFLQPGVPDLADAALREYMRTTVAPGAVPRPALQELRRAVEPPEVSPEQIALAERIQGGGQAPYGKTSFMREAEAPTVEKTQEQIAKENQDALDKIAAQSLGSLREEPGQSTSEVPPEENRPPTDEGGGGLPIEPAPKITSPPGGSVTAKTPEEQAMERANNGRKAFAEAMGVEYIEGESNADFLKRVNEKKLDIPEKKVSESKGVTETAPPETRQVKVGDDISDIIEARDYVHDSVVELEGGETRARLNNGQTVDFDNATRKVTALEAHKPSPNAPQVRTGTTEGTLKSPDTSGKTPPSPGIVDKAISNIESLQSKLRKGPQSGQTLMGVPSAILDTALESARLALKAGKSVAEAIEEAIKHIRFNVEKGKYDESKVRELFEREITNSGKPTAVGRTSETGANAVRGASGTRVSSISEPRAANAQGAASGRGAAEGRILGEGTKTPKTIKFESPDARMGDEFTQDGIKYRVTSVTSLTVNGKTRRQITAAPTEGLPNAKATSEVKAETRNIPQEGTDVKPSSPSGDTSSPRRGDTIRAERPVGRTESTPGTLSESERMRNLSARGTQAETIPPPVREQIKTAEQSYYTQQSVKGVQEVVSKMSDADLAAVTKDSDIYTAAKLEQANRQFKAGNDKAGYETFQNLSEELTRFGQVINQAKLLQGLMPENVVKVVNEGLRKDKKDPLTDNQAGELKARSKERIDAQRQVDEATEEWTKSPTDENAKKADAALTKANEAALNEQRLVHRYQSRSMASLLKAILQGNLLTPISEVANLVGNVSFLPFRLGARTVATGVDMLDSYLRDRPREVAMGNTIEAIKGAARASKQVPDILLKGQDEAIKGESRAGLHPFRAWATQFAKEPQAPTVGGKLSTMDRAKLAIEGTFGMTAEPMLRGLSAGDQPFRGAARGRLISEQAKLKGIPKDQLGMAQRFPEMFFDRKTLDQINEESLAAVFQRRSTTLNHLLSWIKSKGDAFDFLTSTLIPYKVTPWNIVGEIMSFVPPVSLLRAVSEARKGNIRNAEMNLGKMVVGGMMVASATWMYKKGVIAPSLDSQDEQQKARILAGEVLPPNHINLSGLNRAMHGGDGTFRKGDKTVDFFRGGGLYGSVLYLTANVGRDLEKKPESTDALESILQQGALEGARFTLNQSFLKGTATMLDAVQEGNADSAVQAWLNSLESIPLPNTLTALSRAGREYKIDMRPDKSVDKIVNPLKARLGVFGLDDQMNLKRGLWGEPLRETPKDANALVYHFFDISKGHSVTDDATTLELYRLWRRTSDTKVIPTPPGKTMSFAGTNYVLTPSQQGELQERVGKARKEITDRIVLDPNYRAIPDELKIKLLNTVYDKAADTGKGEFWVNHREELKAKEKKAGFQ